MRMISTALASVVLLASAAARANEGDPRPARTFYVASTDEGCASSVGPLAEAITLACDASHASCRASATPGGADRKLVLDCADPDGWNLEAFDASGTTEWTVVLAGPTEDRIRDGAMTALRLGTSFGTGEESLAHTTTPVVETAPGSTDQAERPKATGRADAAKGLVYAGFGVATLSTIIGVALAVDLAHRKDLLNGTEKTGTTCSDGPCAQSVPDDVDGVRRAGTFVDVAIGVAIVGAAAGIVGLVIWPRPPAKTTSLGGRLTPVVGLGSLGLRADF